MGGDRGGYHGRGGERGSYNNRGGRDGSYGRGGHNGGGYPQRRVVWLQNQVTFHLFFDLN